MNKYHAFNYGDSIIGVVNDNVYVGVNTNYNKFVKAIRKQLDQGRRAQFSLIVKVRKLDLTIYVQCIFFSMKQSSLYNCMVVRFGYSCL